MLKLPKVLKDGGRALTRKESVKAAVAGAALAIGVALAGMPAQDAQASVAPSVQSTSQAPQAALLLVPAGQTGSMLADHYSHVSHASHDSHASHASHYSSRH